MKTSKYAVEVRYPDDIPWITLNEAEEAMDLAGKVRENIEVKLKDYF